MPRGGKLRSSRRPSGAVSSSPWVRVRPSSAPSVKSKASRAPERARLRAIAREDVLDAQVRPELGELARGLAEARAARGEQRCR